MSALVCDVDPETHGSGGSGGGEGFFLQGERSRDDVDCWRKGGREGGRYF